jgi:small-conductance mechanosensitive channel
MPDLSRWIHIDLTRIFDSLIASIFIIVISLIALSIVRKVIIRLTNQSKRLNKGTQQRLKTIQSLLINVSTYVIFFIAAVTVLKEFGIDISAILASAGVLGLAIGFGAKDLVADIVTGFFMLIEDQVHVGEQITVNGFSGTVEHVGLRVLKLRGDDGDLHFVLNRDVKSLTNHSRGVKQAHVDLPIPADADLDRAISVLQQECNRLKEQMAGIVNGPEVLGVENISSSEAMIRVIAHTENEKKGEVEREMRKDLKKALDQAQIKLNA